MLDNHTEFSILLPIMEAAQTKEKLAREILTLLSSKGVALNEVSDILYEARNIVEGILYIPVIEHEKKPLAMFITEFGSLNDEPPV